MPKSRGVLGKFDDSELINVFGFLDYCLTKSENKESLFNFYVNSDWSSVESTLANLDLYEFFREEYYPPTHSSEEDKAYDIAECFKYLYKAFWIWVKEIEIDSVVPINAFQELFDCENDIFLHLIIREHWKMCTVQNKLGMCMVNKEKGFCLGMKK